MNGLGQKEGKKQSPLDVCIYHTYGYITSVVRLAVLPCQSTFLFFILIIWYACGGYPQIWIYLMYRYVHYRYITYDMYMIYNNIQMDSKDAPTRSPLNTAPPRPLLRTYST
jgi:hypothetical protein